LPCNEVPAVSEFFNASVNNGFDGGEFVTPEIQFSTELNLVDEITDGSEDPLGEKLETPKKCAMVTKRKTTVELFVTLIF
jgi:hypothetical protein